VLIDTAPVLAVTDGALAHRKAATTLLVLRSGQHPLLEITTALKQMLQNGVRPCAVIVNDERPQASDHSYVKYGAAYQAKARAAPAPPSRRGLIAVTYSAACGRPRGPRGP
jgi:tyrosine-protein kinase Etk/Wzc